MERQPTLQNDLVVIRPLSPTDLEPLFAVANDPKIWEQHPAKRYKRPIFEKFFKESVQSGGALVILDSATQEIIGSSRFHIIPGVSNAIEIGWTFLAPTYWGGQYNRAIKKLMIEHAFEYLDIIVFHVAKGNLRSLRAMEKLNAHRLAKTDYPHIPRKNTENVVYVIGKLKKL